MRSLGVLILCLLPGLVWAQDYPSLQDLIDATEEGGTLTLEPGIYIEGWGGMRLEGNYVINDDGVRRLDTFPSELTVCQ